MLNINKLYTFTVFNNSHIEENNYLITINASFRRKNNKHN
jgi:hypothetical protein